MDISYTLFENWFAYLSPIYLLSPKNDMALKNYDIFFGQQESCDIVSLKYDMKNFFYNC